MNKTEVPSFQSKKIKQSDFPIFFNKLLELEYSIVGSKVTDNVIIYDEIKSVDELPIGTRDVQKNGKYFLEKNETKTLFNYVVGPQSLKKFFFPPNHLIFSAQKNGNNIEIKPNNSKPKKIAFLGIRACDIKSLEIQDKIFLETDPHYKVLRKNSLIIAVNCSTSKDNCFCTSMNCAPKALNGFDISLTEIIENNEHYFCVEIGSKNGEKIISKCNFEKATEKEVEKSNMILKNVAEKIKRKLNTQNLKEKLYNNFENEVWDKVAERCLACANCTMVCPTCFCSTVEDVTDLTGNNAERWRKWDSCFTLEHSYIHGGSIRSSTKSRYRQWATHKFGYWIDQFGTSGCVGCGRCITWCPVGIDVTEELTKIISSQKKEIQ